MKRSMVKIPIAVLTLGLLASALTRPARETHHQRRP